MIGAGRLALAFPPLSLPCGFYRPINVKEGGKEEEEGPSREENVCLIAGDATLSVVRIGRRPWPIHSLPSGCAMQSHSQPNLNGITDSTLLE